MEHKNKWMDTMISIHGSEEAVRAFMRMNADKSKRNLGGRGGFASMKENNSERHKEISRLGGKGGRKKQHNGSGDA